MKYILSLLTTLFAMTFACGQPAPADRPKLQDPAFDDKLEKLLSFTVPLIGVEELNDIQHEVHIFDTRKEEEYQISHIAGATYLGYPSFNPDVLESIPKSDTIVLYCSVGYRSEKIGEKLMKLGYTKVFNLYGSLFEWANQAYPLVDGDGRPTRKIHTYNRDWSQWVKEGKAEKIW